MECNRRTRIQQDRLVLHSELGDTTIFNGYSELRALAPDAYLTWELFGTVYDRDDDYARDQYSKGRKIGQDAKKAGAVYITERGTWMADVPAHFPGAWPCTITSYEGIGYHRSTKDLLHGFIDSGCQIIVYRETGNGRDIKTTTIQEPTNDQKPE